jgi:Ger(x)C family germination protein
MKKTVLLIILMSMSLLLAGCWDRTEINDMAIVVATGIDKGDKQNYRYSVQVPLPSSLGGPGSSGGGGGTSGEGPFIVAQGSGGNFEQGINWIQSRLSRKLYFSHRRVLVIGESLAKEGIKGTLNAIFMQPESRLSTFLLVSKGDALTLLETQPRMEQFSGEALREMAKNSINSTVLDILQDLERPGKEVILPLAEKTGLIPKRKNQKEVEVSSFALFKDDQLRFITNPTESKGILWILEKMNKKSLTFPVSPGKEMTVKIIENHIKQDFFMEGTAPVFDLTIRAEGILLENESDLKLEDPKTYQLVIGKMKKEIKREVNSILVHAHSQSIDFKGFGWDLYKLQQQLWVDQFENKWDLVLPSLRVNVKVSADIQRTTNTGYIEKE